MKRISLAVMNKEAHLDGKKAGRDEDVNSDKYRMRSRQSISCRMNLEVLITQQRGASCL